MQEGSSWEILLFFFHISFIKSRYPTQIVSMFNSCLFLRSCHSCTHFCKDNFGCYSIKHYMQRLQSLRIIAPLALHHQLLSMAPLPQSFIGPELETSCFCWSPLLSHHCSKTQAVSETLHSAGRARLSTKISAIRRQESKTELNSQGEPSPAGTILYI